MGVVLLVWSVDQDARDEKYVMDAAPHVSQWVMWSSTVIPFFDPFRFGVGPDGTKRAGEACDSFLGSSRLQGIVSGSLHHTESKRGAPRKSHPVHARMPLKDGSTVPKNPTRNARPPFVKE